jgi:hypothetical protein
MTETMTDELMTYDPFTVYLLPARPNRRASLSLALSKSYNEQHYYGWAGPKCREDIAVVKDPKSRKWRILPLSDAESLIGK